MNQPDSIDYAPLQTMDGAWLIVLRKVFHGLGWLVTIIVVLAAVGASIATKTFQFGAIVVALYFVYLSRAVTKYKNGVWDSFAAANGWPLDTVTPTDQLLSPSLIFGHSAKFSPVIQASLGDLSVDIFAYNTTTGYGKYSQTHYFTIAQLLLPKSLPHIVLRCKKGDAGIQNDIDNAQTLKLEGDFNDYFTLQIEQGQQIDALTVLTPDVMQVLVDYDQAEDIEINSNSLWFIVRGDHRDTSHVQQLITSVVKLTAQITENIRLSTPTAANDLPDATAQSSTQAPFTTN